jgi:hypothetical protein
MKFWLFEPPGRRVNPASLWNSSLRPMELTLTLGAGLGPSEHRGGG